MIFNVYCEAGGSSYFFTNIRYKGIDILPYSDWIKYYYANKTDIIRYTRRHLLENNEWIKTMDFTAEIYNSSITEPENFEKRWIINEVEEMIKGLERSLNENKNYEVINSYFHSGLRTSLFGRSLIRFKGERISGALIFLEKLKELHSICADIELYIERIMKCNMSIYPRLSTEIEMMQKEHFKLNQDLSKILPEWTKCNNKQKEYDAIKKKYQ